MVRHVVKISIESLWVRFVSIISFALTVIKLYFVLRLPLDVVLSTATLLLIIFVVIALSIDISPYLSSIDTTLRDIREILAGQKRTSPESRRREEVKTTSGGALIGVAIGGLIGSLSGSIGAIISGLIGAIAGNQLEYEILKAERLKALPPERIGGS